MKKICVVITVFILAGGVQAQPWRHAAKAAAETTARSEARQMAPAANGSGALVKVIQGPKNLPSKAGQFRVRVLDKSKLPYAPKQIDQMLAKDRTHADKILAREFTLDNMEKELLKKRYEVMPSTIHPSSERQLLAAMLTSEETAARIARNGGGRSFNIMSKEAAVRTYFARMEEFAALKREIDVKMFYNKADGLSISSLPQREIADMTQRVANMRVHIKFLLLYYFPEDMPLYLANKYLTARLIELQPGLSGLLNKLPVFRRTDRVYTRGEFMLAAPPDAAAVAELPAGLRIAVVNDSPEILNALSNFGRWGSFGKGAQVTTFDNIYTLMESVKGGAAYHVIFSDISMPNGSGMLLVSTLRENNKNIPVIGLSGYKEDTVGGENLFEIGFDGYVMSDEYGYRRAPEALKYYLYYRDLHKWIR